MYSLISISSLQFIFFFSSLMVESQHGSLRFAYRLSHFDEIRGALQVYLKQFDSWALICSDGYTWDAEDTDVACRQLGYQDKGFFYPSNTAIYSDLALLRSERKLYLANFSCSGNESMLLECPSEEIYGRECNHDKIVEISCFSRTGKIIYIYGIVFSPESHVVTT